jgi:hypothetical protein
MINNSGRIGKIMEAVNEAHGLMNEYITPDIEKLMNPEQLEQLNEARTKVLKDMPNASKELEKINAKYKRHASSNNK